MLNHIFLTCAIDEIKDLTVYIVVNGEKFQSRCALDLDETMPNVKLIRATICSSFKWIEPLF